MILIDILSEVYSFYIRADLKFYIEVGPFLSQHHKNKVYF